MAVLWLEIVIIFIHLVYVVVVVVVVVGDVCPPSQQRHVFFYIHLTP